MANGGWTYTKAGVDIDRKSRAIHSLVGQLGFRRRGRGQMAEVEGSFTGLIDFGDVFLTLCTDGVGTKLLVAEAMGRWDTVGIDCIAMNVNDTICVGAEPIAFVDYIALDQPDERLTEEIGKGLAMGAELANMDIVGGEIAVLPDLVKGVDLSGTCLGFAPKDRIINGEKVALGDTIIGLPSSGIHSNGLTLARKIVESTGMKYGEKLEGMAHSVGEELLRPTKIYVKEVLSVLEETRVKGMVNITGGGLRNFLRLKKGVRFEITDPMKPQRIFQLLAELGEVEPMEMYQIFNMGMGFAIVCDEGDAQRLMSSIPEARRVGTVEEGEGVALTSEDIEYRTY
jgi:phosphoribosylformylglycinamidine cyclo-ligase